MKAEAQPSISSGNFQLNSPEKCNQQQKNSNQSPKTKKTNISDNGRQLSQLSAKKYSSNNSTHTEHSTMSNLATLQASKTASTPLQPDQILPFRIPNQQAKQLFAKMITQCEICLNKVSDSNVRLVSGYKEEIVDSLGAQWGRFLGKIVENMLKFYVKNQGNNLSESIFQVETSLDNQQNLCKGQQKSEQKNCIQEQSIEKDCKEEECKQEEQSQNSLNQAVVYDDESILQEMLTAKKQQSEQKYNSDTTILNSILKQEVPQTTQNIQEHSMNQGKTEQKKLNQQEGVNQEQSHILKTPMVKLINNVYPQCKTNSKKQCSQLRFSLLEQSSFDISKQTDPKSTKFFIEDSCQHSFTSEYPWVQSLIRLSRAQTQLTYLCQFKNWRLKFIQGIHRESYSRAALQYCNKEYLDGICGGANQPTKFRCQAQVNVQFKDTGVRKFFGICESANSKKDSRHNAALFCLFELYRSITGLWEQYEAAKNYKPSLRQLSNSNNLLIFLDAGVNLTNINLSSTNNNHLKNQNTNQNYYQNYNRYHQKKDKLKYRQRQPQSQNIYNNTNKQNQSQNINIDHKHFNHKQCNGYQENKAVSLQHQQSFHTAMFQMSSTDKQMIHKYLCRLRTHKKQLYYFIGQYNKVFLQPEWKYTKIPTNDFWSAQGTVKYQLNNNIYECRYQCVDRSKKVAEDKVSRNILKQLYTRFIDLFNNFRVLKEGKGLC